VYHTVLHKIQCSNIAQEDHECTTTSMWHSFGASGGRPSLS